MPQGGAQGKNLGIFFKQSFIIEQQLLFLANFLFDIQTLGLMHQGGTEGKNQGHL